MVCARMLASLGFMFWLLHELFLIDFCGIFFCSYNMHTNNSYWYPFMRIYRCFLVQLEHMHFLLNEREINQTQLTLLELIFGRYRRTSPDFGAFYLAV